MKIHHICIQTDNYKESLDFYLNALGFSLIKETENFHSRLYNSWLDLNGFMIELQTNKKDQVLKEVSKDTKGIVHFCLYTDDIEVEYETLLKSGFDRFQLKNDQVIYEVEGGKLLKAIAPEGTIIEIRDQIDL